MSPKPPRVGSSRRLLPRGSASPGPALARRRKTHVVARVALAATLVTPGASAGSTLLVSGYDNDAVLRFDLDTGALTGQINGVPGAQSVRYGPDGDVYVCAEKINQVLRFDGDTLLPLGPLVSDDPNTPGDETGGLSGPTAAVFAPDGSLLVASFNTDNVLRYDGQTGAFLGEFVAAGLGNLNGPDAGMTFGPDGALYVPSFFSNRVNRYDASGAFLGMFAGPLQGISRPRMVRFRSDGVMYVTSWGNGRVLRFAPDGAPLGTLVNTNTPTGLLFDPANGDLLVTSDNQNYVRRFAKDGTSKGAVVAPGIIQGGTFVELWPDPELRLDRPSGVVGQTNTLAVRNGTPNGVALLLLGAGIASLDTGNCPPTPLGVAAPALLPWSLDASGGAAISGVAPTSLLGVTAAMQVVEPGACRVSNLVVVTFQ